MAQNLNQLSTRKTKVFWFVFFGQYSSRDGNAMVIKSRQSLPKVQCCVAVARHDRRAIFSLRL